MDIGFVDCALTLSTDRYLRYFPSIRENTHREKWCGASGPARQIQNLIFASQTSKAAQIFKNTHVFHSFALCPNRLSTYLSFLCFG